MITIQQLETGLADYLDTYLIPQLPNSGWQKVVIATGVSIALKRLGGAINSLKSNPVLNALGIIDEQGNIDIDIITEELKNNIPDTGFVIDLGVLNVNMKFNKHDVEDLYKCIVKKQQEVLVQNHSVAKN